MAQILAQLRFNALIKYGYKGYFICILTKKGLKKQGFKCKARSYPPKTYISPTFPSSPLPNLLPFPLFPLVPLSLTLLFLLNQFLMDIFF